MRIELDNTLANARVRRALGFDAIMTIDVGEGSYDEGIWSSSPPLTLARHNNSPSSQRK